MVANTSPIFGLAANVGPDGGTNGGITFVNADGTTAKTAFTAGANGSMLQSLNVHSDDTSAVTIDVSVDDGSASYRLGTVVVAIGAGDDGTEPSVDLMDSSLIPALLGGLFVPAGWTVEVAPEAAVTAAKTVTIVAVGVDY